MTDIEVKQLAEGFLKTNVKDDGVSFKGKSLILDSEKDCDEVVEAINSCKDLQYLNLEGNTLGVEASKAISKALECKSELKKALWMDIFTGRLKKEIPRALENLGNGLILAGAQLTELDISDNAFGPIGVEGLKSLLSSKACYQLEVLKFNNNGLGIAGGKMLAAALMQCHENSTKDGKPFALKLFIAGRNRLENEGASELAKVFKTLGTLEEIVMPQNGISHEGIKALSDALKNNPNLKVLNLNDNIIKKKGAKHIANALPHLQQLQILNLGDCLLKTSGATLLANALADKHEHLEELHLGWNEIRSDGGLAVVNAVTNKHKLRQLNVNGNIFGSGGRILLKEGLEKNKRIETLDELGDDNSHDEDNDSEEDSEEENIEDNLICRDDNSHDEDNDSEEDSEEENIEENKANGFTKVIESQHPEMHSGKRSSMKKDPLDSLSSVLDEMSIKAKPVGPLKTFLDSPTVENFSQVKKDKIYEFIENNQDSSVEFYINTFVPMLVKISSLSSCGDLNAAKLSLEVSKSMYKDLFAWALDKNQVATVNNQLFVYLGLLKSEDKNFKINWDVKGSLSALKDATSEGKVPVDTQNILKCFMEREARKPFCESITVG